VVFLPSALLTRADDRAKADQAKSRRAKAERAKTEGPRADRAETVRPAPAPEPPAAPAAPAPAAPAAAAAEEKPSLTAGGLPRRRRVSAEAGQPQSAAHSQPAASSPAASNTEFDQQYPAAQGGEAGRSARQTAGDLGAWQRGTRSGRATVPPESEGKSQA
jgi:hypothetical protein